MIACSCQSLSAPLSSPVSSVETAHDTHTTISRYHTTACTQYSSNSTVPAARDLAVPAPVLLPAHPHAAQHDIMNIELCRSIEHR